MFFVSLEKQARKDRKLLKAAKLEKKAREYLEIVTYNPFQSPPPYEILAENLRGLYSRRLNIQHRFVYEVSDEPVEIDGIKYDGIVKVIRMWTHYDGV